MAMPLREYYSLSRAAELLDCKVDDLIHWASVGGINIYIPIESGMGYVHLCNDDDEENFDLLYEKFEDESFFNDGFSKVASFYNQEESVIDDFFQNEPPFEGFEPCVFSGLWALPRSAYLYDELCEFKPSFFDLWLSTNKVMFIAFEIDNYLNYSDSNLYLMKSDFLLISKFKDGKEIPNFFNGYEIKPIAGFDEVSHLASSGRTSRSAKDAIKIMVEKHYPEVSGNYKRLAEILSAEANNTLGMNGVRFDDTTIARWLKS